MEVLQVDPPVSRLPGWAVKREQTHMRHRIRRQIKTRALRQKLKLPVKHTKRVSSVCANSMNRLQKVSSQLQEDSKESKLLREKSWKG